MLRHRLPTHATALAFAPLSALLAAAPTSAQERPIQLSLFSPIQAVPEEAGISGARLSILYGRNASMTGVDLGLVTHTTGAVTALQWGAVHLVEEEFTGWQTGFVNVDGSFTGFGQGAVNLSHGEVKGLQFGAANIGQSTLRGAQVGVYNQAATTRGLQLGIVNFTQGTGSVVQVGLVNIIAGKDRFPILPIVNWSLSGS